ncbi:murein L,D-transpeptidase YcbB/YkuD [Sphingomonas sp. UYAg733]
MNMLYDQRSARRSGVGVRVLGAALAASMLTTPVVAQQVVPPPVVPTPIAPPSLPVRAPVTLPELTDTQAAQLAMLIDKDAVAQGLREDPTPRPATATRDALVGLALDHAKAVHSGRLDVADFQREWGIRPQAYDPLPGFVDALKRDRLAAWVAALPPPYAGYDALVTGLARYRAIAATGGWTALTAGAELKLGATGDRVLALRKRLALEDPLIDAAGTKFDAGLEDAVKRAQRRYGLNPAGLAGAQTMAALNVPVEARVRQIMANMERWRWLPEQLEKDRVQVNIAAAVLTVFDGDAPVMSMKAVTGRPGDETPMLVSQIHSIVLNPPWNVPSTIANRELWPKEKAKPGYLKRNGFRIIDTGDGGKRLQQSSERSALGKFKFDFDNAFAVYLHDTPAQAGFARFDRLASHGCVRLEKPADLAKLLMRSTPEWAPATIDATVDAGKTVRAKIANPVAVYLLYWTAFANTNGLVSFRDDPYRWDGSLAGKIEARSAKQALASR